MDMINEFDKDKLARINELAKIAKERELSKEEADERAVLRKEFLENFRAGFRQQLSNIKVVSPEEVTEEIEEIEEEIEEIEGIDEEMEEEIEMEIEEEIEERFEEEINEITEKF